MKPAFWLLPLIGACLIEGCGKISDRWKARRSRREGSRP